MGHWSILWRFRTKDWGFFRREGAISCGLWVKVWGGREREIESES